MAQKKARVLVVDDNKDILKALKYLLEDYFTTVDVLSNPELILRKLSEGWDVVLLDMNFRAGYHSGNEGLYWMEQIHKIDPDIPVVLITAYAEISLAVEAVKRGAEDFVEKPWNDERMVSMVLKAYRTRKARLEIRELREKNRSLVQQSNPVDFVKGKSASMQRLLEVVNKVAPTDANVLITGENGTGKEVLARQLHSLSQRKDDLFVSADMHSLSQSLFESELFGHVKGAFTDAKTDRIGRFEMASGGTLFLDEIGNLTLALQAKILTVLNNRQVVRVGSNSSIPIDIRLICATNQNLFRMVEQGTFREDLLYRLNTISIEIPPLRERVDDIPELAEFYLSRFTSRYGKEIVGISSRAMKKLKAYMWPGNVRELKHAIEKAVILSDGSVLDEKDFDFHRNESSQQNLVSFNLEETERIVIAAALKKHGGRINETVAELGVSRKTLYNKMKKYGL